MSDDLGVHEAESTTLSPQKITIQQFSFEIIDGLPSSISVYLKATVDTLADRLKDSIEKRPLISHLQNPVELKEFIKKHLFERSFYYEKSKVIIKTDDLDVNTVVKLINQLLT